VSFYVLNDTASSSDANGLSTEDYSSTEFKDIWDALRVNSKRAPNIGNNVLEIVIDREKTFYNKPIDVLYIPMSRMLWKLPS
jgi:hypothetical protein